ncbi:STAS domain-containing protein [Chloroflexales bacterium ZM16-3]|nr:STAS domain-containing protein [Chloroflexales bacterium ZM16-3]
MIARIQAWLRAVEFRDPLEHQQSFLVQTLLLSLIAVTLLSTPLPFLSELPIAQAFAVEALVLLELPLYLGALALLRRGKLAQSVILTSVSIVLLCVGVLMSTGTRSSGAAMFTFALPLVFAGLLAGRSGALWIVGLSLVGITTVMALEASGLPLVGFAAQHGENFGGVLGGYLSAAAVLSVFVTRFGRALREALRAALDREREIAEQRDALERTVGERTSALRGALADVESRAAAQAALLEELAQQREAIRELSVPLLPVGAGTLVMPLVGSLDTARLQTLQDRALHEAQGGAVRRLILDISGVLLVDSQVALGLLNTVRATRLLGVDVAMVGIRPEVAQALVGLGLDLDEVQVYRDLEDALIPHAHRHYSGGQRD